MVGGAERQRKKNAFEGSSQRNPHVRMHTCSMSTHCAVTFPSKMPLMITNSAPCNAAADEFVVVVVVVDVGQNTTNSGEGGRMEINQIWEGGT